MFQRLRQFYLVSSKIQGWQKVLVIIAVTIEFSITAAFFFWQDALIKELRYVENSVHLNDMLSFGEIYFPKSSNPSASQCVGMLCPPEIFRARGTLSQKTRQRKMYLFPVFFSDLDTSNGAWCVLPDRKGSYGQWFFSVEGLWCIDFWQDSRFSIQVYITPDRQNAMGAGICI